MMVLTTSDIGPKLIEPPLRGTVEMRPLPPFDLNLSLNFLGSFATTEKEQSILKGALVKATVVDGSALVLKFESIGTLEAPRLRLSLYSENELTPRTRDEGVRRASSYLSMYDGLSSFYALGMEDKAFRPVIERLYGYHQVKFITPFESAAWAILSQRVRMVQARNVKQGLMRKIGKTVMFDGEELLAFPEPRTVAALGINDATDLIRNARRSDYLLSASKAFSSVDPGFLAQGSYDQVLSWLKEIRGVGDWSAGLIMIRGLGRMDHAPLEDPSLLRAFRKVYGNQDRGDLANTAAHYGTSQGYWAHYLRAASIDRNAPAMER